MVGTKATILENISYVEDLHLVTLCIIFTWSCPRTPCHYISFVSVTLSPPNYHLLLHWVTLTSDSISRVSLRYEQFPLGLPPVTYLTLSYFSGLVPPRNHCTSTNHMATINSTLRPSLSLLLVKGRAIIPVLAVSDIRKNNQHPVGLTPAPGSSPPYPAMSPDVSWLSSIEECFKTSSLWIEESHTQAFILLCTKSGEQLAIKNRI